MSESSVNVRHFLIIALGGNSFLHSYIEDIYQERKWEYYECYRKSNMYKDALIPRHTTKNEEKMKQVAGITEWCYQHNDFEKLYRLIKKGYKFVYQFVQQNRVRGVNFDQFEVAFLKRNGGVEKVSDLQLFYGASVALYLCHKEQLPYELNGYGRMFLDAMRDVTFEIVAKEFRYSKENKEKFKDRINELFKHYDIPRNMKPMSMGKFFELFIEKQMMKKGEENPFISLEKARQEVFKEGISKYIGSISNWVKNNGINEMDLTESLIITKNDVETAFLDFIISKQFNSNRLTDADRDLYIVAILYIQTLASVYLDTKRLYLDDSQEQHYIELKEIEKSIKEKEEILIEQEQRIRSIEQNRVESISLLEEELRKTQKALQQTQIELEKREDHSKEVAALRAYVYSLNTEDSLTQELTVEQLVNRIQQKKVAVVGGHPNWIHKMKEVLPGVSFAEVEEINRDLSYIDNVDVVFVYATFFNHKFYKKLMKYMSNNNTQLVYLSGKSNVELTLREMERAIK
ncbi:hypothetical protein ACFVS2_20635 [Brevibacillus sp. NPDC058079]|uniref:hypothetical protein n=1 Tax=Brevibacillus sp. NPDC058079 TaxID=3346330 RepID=UPI0036EE6941